MRGHRLVTVSALHIFVLGFGKGTGKYGVCSSPQNSRDVPSATLSFAHFPDCERTRLFTPVVPVPTAVTFHQRPGLGQFALLALSLPCFPTVSGAVTTHHFPRTIVACRRDTVSDQPGSGSKVQTVSWSLAGRHCKKV